MKTLLTRSTLVAVGTMGVLSLSMVCAMSACSKSDHDADTGTSGATPPAQQPRRGVTNAQPVSESTTVERIASKRCDHEMGCNDVGNGKKYPSYTACMDAYRGTVAAEVNGYACPKGVDQTKLDACLSAIGSADCKAPFLAMQRIDACRSADVCQK